jgi:hypothetical protein
MLLLKRRGRDHSQRISGLIAASAFALDELMLKEFLL